MCSPGSGGPRHQLTELIVDEPLIPRDVAEANQNSVQEASAGNFVAGGLALGHKGKRRERRRRRRKKERKKKAHTLSMTLVTL